MSVVGYFLMLGGFASAAVWLVNLAGGNTQIAVTFGILAACAFVVSITIMTTLTRKQHHSPLLPDNTDVESMRYLKEYRGS